MTTKTDFQIYRARRPELGQDSVMYSLDGKELDVVEFDDYWREKKTCWEVTRNIIFLWEGHRCTSFFYWSDRVQSWKTSRS